MQTELYFAGDGDFGPFSARNELESLNSVLSVINPMLLSATDDNKEVLQVLRDTTIDMMKSFGSKNIVEKFGENCNSDAENLLLQWGKNHGVKAKLQIACKSLPCKMRLVLLINSNTKLTCFSASKANLSSSLGGFPYYKLMEQA